MTIVTDNEQQSSSTGQDGGRLSSAKQRASETLGTARTRASDAYSTARDRTSSAYDSARERASSATRATAEGIDANPGAALIGGLALGALAAVLLPKTRKEEELLGTYGRQINEKAKEAARAAKEAGQSKLDEMGLNKDTAKQKLSEVANQAKEAVKQSATAAAQAAKSTAASQDQGTSATSLPTA